MAGNGKGTGGLRKGGTGGELECLVGINPGFFKLRGYVCCEGGVSSIYGIAGKN